MMNGEILFRRKFSLEENFIFSLTTLVDFFFCGNLYCIVIPHFMEYKQVNCEIKVEKCYALKPSL